MKKMVQSQAFSQFVLERLERSETDYEVLFFDESIKAKLNRSKLRFTKETTPFLKETSYQVSTTITSLPPIMEQLELLSGDNVALKLSDYLIWNKLWDIQPRIIQPLLAESDFKMMRSHTHGLVQRARNAELMVFGLLTLAQARYLKMDEGQVRRI